jgi:hypothetical protein
MPSPQLPFDDDGTDLDRPPLDDDTEHAADRAASRGRSTRREGPNYWIRRGVVVGGVVAFFAAAALIVDAVIDDTAPTPDGAASAEWNRVVTVDARSGRIGLQDADGDDVARIDTGRRAVDDAVVIDRTVVLTSAEVVTVVDVAEESTADIELSGGSVVRPSGSALTAIVGTPDGARGVLVHGPTGDVVDTDAFAPIAGTRFEWADSRTAPSGRHVLVTDSGNFQSVLYSFDRDAPSYVPGLALAVDDRLVVTAQNVGNRATVTVFDHDGEQRSSGTAPSVRAAMIVDDVVQLVTVDGAVVTMAVASGEIDEGGTVEIGAVESGDVTAGGDRLIVSGSEGTAIVGPDGDPVATFPGLRTVPDPWATHGSTCTALVEGADDDRRLSVIELTTGDVRSEATVGDRLFASADGCTIADAVPDGYQLVSSDAVRTVADVGEAVGLSPDGARIVLERDQRQALAVAADGSDPVDLGPAGRIVGFTET